MITANDDWRFEFPTGHHLIERKARAVTITQPDPRDTCGQALKGDPLARHVEPVVQMRVLGKQFFHFLVGFIDILGIARQRHPAERANATAEQRADICGNKTGEGKGIFQTFVQGDLANVVAVI